MNSDSIIKNSYELDGHKIRELDFSTSNVVITEINDDDNKKKRKSFIYNLRKSKTESITNKNDKSYDKSNDKLNDKLNDKSNKLVITNIDSNDTYPITKEKDESNDESNDKSNDENNDDKINNDTLNKLYIYKEITIEVNNYVKKFHLNQYSVILLCTKVIEIVKSFKKLSVDERKEYTENLCLSVIEKDEKLLKNEKEYVRLMLSTFIDFTFELSNKKFKLNIKKNKKLKNKSNVELVDLILEKVLSIIKKKEYNSKSLIKNFPILIGITMSFISAIPKISKAEKKNITIQVINKLLEDNIYGILELSETEKEILQFIIKTLPQTIDIIASIYKGEFKLKEQMNKIFLCCSKIKNLAIPNHCI